MKYRALLVPGLFCLWLLGGCDIAPEARLSGNPINQPGEQLDPSSPDNLTGYFYLDRPVAGLNVRCDSGGDLPYLGTTGSGGKFVCPRGAVATFYVGGESGALELGSVELSIYGAPEDGARRNDVVITPSTLYGTATDGSQAEVSNVFNLLVSLDVGGAGAQPAYVLTEEVHAAAATYGLGTTSVSFDPAVFVALVQPILVQIHESPDVVLARRGEMLPLSGDGNVRELADAALRKARYGIYREALMLGELGGQQVYSSISIMVDRDGRMTGIGRSFISGSSGTTGLETYVMPAGNYIPANGLIDGLLFEGAGDKSIAISGRLVNDTVWGLFEGNDDPLDRQTNTQIPSSYIFSPGDYGEFVLDQEAFRGSFSMTRTAESLPDIDLAILPAGDPDITGFRDNSPEGYLPIDYAIEYRGYKDGITTPEEDLDDPDALGSVARTMGFRILASGDIVSDLDLDCAALEKVDGDYREVGTGNREYVIGQVGAVFRAEDGVTYMTLLLAHYDPALPEFGFTMGIPAINMDSLGAVVLNTSTGKIINKSCGTDPDCSEPIEWLNDMRLMEIIKGDLAGDGQWNNNALLKRDDYYGRVTTGSRICLTPLEVL